MSKIEEKKSIIEEVDLIDDREYILQCLKEAEQRYKNWWKFYTLEESYNLVMEHLDDLAKEYGRI